MEQSAESDLFKKLKGITYCPYYADSDFSDNPVNLDMGI